MRPHVIIVSCLCLASFALTLRAGPPPAPVPAFIEQHCAGCHDDLEKKGDLDLTALALLEGPENRAVGEGARPRRGPGMPPKKNARRQWNSGNLSARWPPPDNGGTRNPRGEATLRRLNRYANTRRRARPAAGAVVAGEGLPEDGEAFRFNKIGGRSTCRTTDGALSQLWCGGYRARVERPATKRPAIMPANSGFCRPMKFSVFNTAPERATFRPRSRGAARCAGAGLRWAQPIRGARPRAWARWRAPEPLGQVQPVQRPVGGRYRLRFNYSVWVGPGKPVAGKPDR